MSKYLQKFHNLLFSKTLCCVCLVEENDLTKWDVLHEIVKDDNCEEVTLKDMLTQCYGADIHKSLATDYFCESCANVVIKSYLMLYKIKRNDLILQEWSVKMMKQLKIKENAKKITIYLDAVIRNNTPKLVDKEMAFEKNIEDNYENIEYLDDEELIFECPLCFIGFNVLESYEEHYAYCSKKHFKSHNDNKSLEEVTPSYESYTCGICSQSLESLLDLKAHRNNHKKAHQRSKTSNKIINEPPQVKEVENDNKLICDICGKLICSKLMLKHKALHEQPKQYVQEEEENNKKSCSFCSYKTKYHRLLDGHVNRKHLHVRPYICNICSKGFHCKLQLAGHVKTHQQIKKEQCELCGEKFAYKKSLLYHMRFHTGDKPYACMYCDKRFLSSSERHKHEVNKHTATDFTCSICKKQYTSATSLRGHRSKVHGTTRNIYWSFVNKKT